MPSFRFTVAEATTLARYLTETFTTRRKAEEAAEAKVALDPALSEEGKLLVTGLGCMNCHAGPGEKPEFKLGPDLRQVGDRDVRGLYWASMGQDWNMRLESYLRTKVSTPRAFNKNHLMPKYRFAPDEVESIVVALMSFSENPVPEESRFRLWCRTSLRSSRPPAPRPSSSSATSVFSVIRCVDALEPWRPTSAGRATKCTEIGSSLS